MAVYDRIGGAYSAHRRPDPRWAAAVDAALGPSARRIVNVGAGTGSYEPDGPGRDVVAVEPSATMLAQRPASAAPAVQAVAERLPFPDQSFDAAMAILTVHHWSDPAAGLAELQRVAQAAAVLTWDADAVKQFWLVRDYLPEIAAHEAGLATLDAIVTGLPGAFVEPLPVPADCTDGALGAFWRRPHAYLDPSVRSAMSGLALLDQRAVDRGVAALAADLESGAWAERNASLLDVAAIDVGYRIVRWAVR